MVAACSGSSEGADPGATTTAAGSPAVLTPTGSAGQPATAPATPTGSSATPVGTGALPTAPSTPTGAAGAPSSAGIAGAPGSATPPDGSTVAQPPAASGEVSQWCGVKQTLDANCTACHDGNKTAGAPMSLKKYEDLTAAAVSDPTKKVYQVVGLRVHDTARPMPPQQKLTAAQLSGIDTWVAAGAPAGGDPTCANSAPATPTTQEDTWPTDCDATYTILSHGTGGDKVPYSVPAGQEVHPNISVPAPWGNEQMQAIAFRSITDNPKVLHHWILYGPSREFLVGWAPGKQVISTMGQDIGMNLAGGTLTMNMHYNNLQGTTEQSDNSGVEICALKSEHFRKNTAAVYMGFSQFAINIPARATNVDVTGQCTVSGNTPVTLISASPHAHTLAHHMKFTVQKKSGEMIVMHDGPFDFNEQQSYALDTPVVLNAGDTVTTTCTYDNPTDRAVTFGENTGNEMCFNFATYYPMNTLNCGGFGGLPAGFTF